MFTTSDSNNSTKKETFQEQLAKAQLTKQDIIEEEIIEAKEPQYLLDLPIVVAEKNEDTILNMILSDAGMGKSLFVRSLLTDIVKDDIIILYFDLEYVPVVSKERKFQELTKYKNFVLIRAKDIWEFKEKTKISTTATIVNNMIEGFITMYKDKKIMVIIDSFEDYIEDTSNDTELKRVLRKVLSYKGVTCLINHHISKDTLRSDAMRFRGSMVIKAKVTSMLFLKSRKKENDFEELFEFEILKIRTAYKPVRKLSVRVDLKEFKIKDVIVTSDSEEIYILKTAYFILKKEEKLKKTELINLISEKINKNITKIRSVIDKNIEFFIVEKGDKRTEYFSLNLNKDKLDKLFSIIGISGKLSEEKQKLFDTCKALQAVGVEQITEIGINFFGVKHSYNTLSAILNNIYTMQDSEATEILNGLFIQFELLDAVT